MNDTQRLLDSTFPFVKDLLEKYREFYPVGCAVETNDSIAQVGTYQGDNHPSSDKVLADLKTAFKAKKDDYKSVAIFYDVKVVKANTNRKTDAIAVFVEQKNEDKAYTFYYPYTLTEKQLVFSDPWKEIAEKEIFISF